MNELLIAEMKRAIELLERNPELERVIKEPSKTYGYQFYSINKELVELSQLMHLIRKHTILLDKEIKDKSAYVILEVDNK